MRQGGTPIEAPNVSDRVRAEVHLRYELGGNFSKSERVRSCQIVSGGVFGVLLLGLTGHPW